MKTIFLLALMSLSGVWAYGQKSIYNGTIRWEQPNPTVNNYNRIHTVDVQVEVTAGFQGTNSAGGATIGINAKVIGVNLISVVGKNGQTLAASSLPNNIVQNAEQELRFHNIKFDVASGGNHIANVITQRPLSYYQVFGVKPNVDDIAKDREKMKQVYDQGLQVSNISFDPPSLHSTALPNYLNAQDKEKPKTAQAGSQPINQSPTQATIATTARRTGEPTSPSAESQRLDEKLAELEARYELDRQKQAQNEAMVSEVTTAAVAMGEGIASMIQNSRDSRDRKRAYADKEKARQELSRKKYSAMIAETLPYVQSGDNSGLKFMLDAYDKLYTEGNDKTAHIQKMDVLYDLGFNKRNALAKKYYTEYLTNAGQYYLTTRKSIRSAYIKTPIYLLSAPVMGYYSVKMIKESQVKTLIDPERDYYDYEVDNKKLIPGIVLGFGALLSTTFGFANWYYGAKDRNSPAYIQAKSIYQDQKKHLKKSIAIVPGYDPYSQTYLASVRLTF